jgi:signal transduction histidine kinase
MRRNSIQRDLSRWLMLTSLVLVLVTGLVSAALAFFEARQIQDRMLREIGNLASTGMPGEFSFQRRQNLEEESIIVQVLNSRHESAKLSLPADLAEGLQTIRLAGEEWRVLVLAADSFGQRLAIAQQTELRDNVAWASSLNVLFPVLTLVVLMLVVIHFILRIRLQPLKTRADRLDQQEVTRLTPLPARDVPEEIAPFVASINTLMDRTRLAMQQQQRFIADAAHELRTPITALSLLSENLGHARSASERRERQSMLQQGLDRISDLIVQLLDLSRLQSDTENPTTAISLNRVVVEVISDLYPLAESAQLDLGVERQEPVTVMEGRLGQLVRNAIDNAIRNSPRGASIDVSIFAEDGDAVFCVDDNGSGIPEDELRMVMEPFYRTRETARPGNGLGLAICEEIAQRHGGAISLSNRSGGGLRFSYRQRLAAGESANPQSLG